MRYFTPWEIQTVCKRKNIEQRVRERERGGGSERESASSSVTDKLNWISETITHEKKGGKSITWESGEVKMENWEIAASLLSG